MSFGIIKSIINATQKIKILFISLQCKLCKTLYLMGKNSFLSVPLPIILQQ